MYDIIGDIHGQADELQQLLLEMGYTMRDGHYQHDNRQVVFLGDFIDRGGKQRGVINLVRPMIESGTAQSVMGNHEFNALAYHTRHPDKPDSWLRPRTQKNTHQHSAFLADYEREQYEGELQSVLNFFKTLPLWLELEHGPRVIHACWHEASMELLRSHVGASRTMSDELLVFSSDKNRPEYTAVENLLKGLELDLPPGRAFNDKDGHLRTAVRIKWWLKSAKTFGDVAMPPEVVKKHPELYAEPLPEDGCPGYPIEDVPVFFGHYWFSGDPGPVTANVACLDYSVAKPGGKLVAYRWDGERQLQTSNFISVDRAQS